MIDNNTLKKYYESLKKNNYEIFGKELSKVGYAMGLSGESAEVSELIKKEFFHGHTIDRVKLLEELGDVFFYFFKLTDIYNIDLEEVIEYNLKKIKKRYPEGFSKKDSINRK